MASFHTSVLGFGFLGVRLRTTDAINSRTQTHTHTHNISPTELGANGGEDTAANKRDETRRREGPVEDEPRVQALLTHEVTAGEKALASHRIDKDTR